MNKKNKILVIGDTHFRDFLSYSSNIKDGRDSEKKEILDFILESSKDCDHVIFLGDFFNSRNNSSEVNRQAVEFLEKFKNKEIYVINGNHCKKGDGKTAIDFLQEIKHSNWHIFTKPQDVKVDDLKISFLPYMLKSELGTENDEQSTDKIVKDLPGGDILFAHYSISDTTFNGLSTNALKEVVLPKAELEKKYKLIVAGHIHEPQQYDKVVLAGSLFSNTINEIEKFIWKVDENFIVEKIKVPCREIHGIENPTMEQLQKIPKSSIIKATVSDKKISIEELKNELSKFDASILIENYHNTRKKVHIEDSTAFDFSIENLLKMYSESKNIDLKQLLYGLELIEK